MKSPFKLGFMTFLFFVCLFITQSHARDVILVENLSHEQDGLMLLKILENKFNIPRKLITYKSVQRCTTNTDALMQLCLKTNGEMEIVKLDKFVVENAMRVFTEVEAE